MENGEAAPIVESNVKSLWESTTKYQKLILFDILLNQFLLNFNIAVPGPFFARVVIEKGGNVAQSTIILQSLMLSITLCSVVFGKYQIHIGSKNLMMGGIFLSGLGQFLLGFLNYIHDITIFTVSGIIFRIISGIGNAGFVVAALTISSQEFPEHISKIVGFISAVEGSAYFIGPLFGGVIYDRYGMIIPLFAGGCLLMMKLPISLCILRGYSVHVVLRKSSSVSFLSLITNLNILVLLIFSAIVTGIWAYFDVTITTYLKLKGFSTSEVGIVVFVVGATYAVSGVITGYIVGKRWVRQLTLLLGSLSYATFHIFLTPDLSRTWVYILTALIGVTSAMAFVPSFEELLIFAYGSTIPDTEMKSKASGLWFGTYSLGMFIVPIAASFIQDYYGSFSQAMFWMSILQFFMSIVLGLTFCVQRCRSQERAS